jgi:ABC-type multidrug transport system fused ATPase/permease subunit
MHWVGGTQLILKWELKKRTNGIEKTMSNSTARLRIFPLGTIRTIIRIFPRAFQGYFFRILIITLLGFVTGMIEGIGVNALIPAFSFFDQSGRQPTDFISRTMAQIFSAVHIPYTLPAILFFIVFLFLLRFIGVVLNSYLVVRIQTGYEQAVKGRLLESTLQADWPYLIKQKLGNLETLIKIDSSQSSAMLNSISALLIIFATLVAYILIAINISKTVTFAALVFGIIVLTMLRPLFSSSRMLSQKISKINVVVAHHINESLVGIKTLKALGAEREVVSLGRQFFETIRGLQTRLAIIGKISVESVQPLGTIFMTLVVAFAFYKTSYNLGAVAALVYLIQRIFLYTQNIQGTMYNISTALPYVENVTSYLEEAEKAKESSSTHKEEVGAAFQFNKELAFNSVSFSYTGREEALQPISFVIKKGEMVGFIGPSGAGKTTIFDLLLRFLRPTTGEISVDEKDIYSIGISDWRRNISYVSQDIFLLTDTVLNNIKFFDESVTREDVEKASKMAHIYDFIETLPEKFDTLVGERGALLSAGQRQRIALARALARKPRILLLDEATSALDNESEQHIQKAIDNLKGEMTILVIAHRISTVLDADKLFVVEKGNIVESGDPRELLKNKDSYFYKVSNLRK